MRSLHKQEPIDLQKIALTIWGKRRFVIKVCLIFWVVAVIYAYSQPRGYSAGVSLAPEMTESNSLSGGISSLASMAGINLNGAGADAIYPELYPDVISSKRFLVGLFDVRVKSSEGDIDTTLYAYYTKYQRSPWWGYAIGGVKKMIKAIFSSEPKGSASDVPDPFWLSEEQDEICEALKGSISCGVDKKTGVISIGYVAQDPLIAAAVTDSIRVELQEFIIAYRTSKARNDLAYMERLSEEARMDYVNAQQRFADFCDKNREAFLQSYVQQKRKLESDVNIAEGVYTQVAQQVQMAKAKVQEKTPAFTVLSSPTVPLKPSSPKRLFIMIGAIMFGFVVSSFYVYTKEQMKAASENKD